MKTRKSTSLKVALSGFITCLLLLAAGLGFAAITKRPPSLPLMTSAAVIGFCSIFYIWIYWIFHYYKQGNTRKLLLCFILPYVYALYETVLQLKGNKEK